MIKENVRKILNELPVGVELVAAAKTRSAEEILEAVKAGIKIIGENYVQEAEKIQALTAHRSPLTVKIKWHFIGHLQRNKVKRATNLFDIIESVDCLASGEEINKASVQEDKIMPILIEINSGREEQKFGVLPENAEDLVRKLSKFSNIKIMGLMTMGPRFGNPEDARPYFKETKKIFERIKTANFPNVEMKFLSMGMSNSYRIAIAEGANIVRIGTGIFGKR